MSLAMDARRSLLNAIALRPSLQLCQAVNYAVFCCTEIQVDIKWPTNRFSSAKGLLYIQQTAMVDFEKGIEFLAYICANARQITKISLNIEVKDTQMADAIFHTLLNGKKVQLEEIRVRRRYVGQQFPQLIQLIKAQSKTLRIIGKLGLGEAMQAFDNSNSNNNAHNIHLERLSLMNFDLIQDGEMESAQLAENTRDALRRLAGLGATFDHLSYTTFSGFDITKNPNLFMLKSCQVKSIRLTQQKGVAISEPTLVRPLLPQLTNIELVGNMEVKAKDLQVLFPNLDTFHFHQQDLVTGAAAAAAHSRMNSMRSASGSMSGSLDSMNMHFPIAAAC